MKKLILSFVLLMSFAAFGQQGVDHRESNQAGRIDQGAQSGSLSKGEARRLDRQQNRIDKREDHMESKDNGQLTEADKRRLTRQQNRASRRIYRDKHNARQGQ
jgi:hypothetical protein